MRKRAKIDSNQPEIVEAARKLGATVALLHQLGGGVPDILIGYRGINYLCELKNGSLSPSRRVLTPDEDKFHTSWKGQICVIESIDDLIKLLS